MVKHDNLFAPGREDDVTTPFRNVGNYLPVDMALHPRKREYSATQEWETQVSQLQEFCSHLNFITANRRRNFGVKHTAEQRQEFSKHWLQKCKNSYISRQPIYICYLKVFLTLWCEKSFKDIVCSATTLRYNKQWHAKRGNR